MHPPCESTHHAGKSPYRRKKNLLTAPKKSAYCAEKILPTARRKICLPAGEKTPYRMMANSSYRAHSMQAVVGGMIQEYQPFYDESDPRVENVTIYCHEEGKLRNLERNRAIADPDGRILDIIRGPFFICYSTIESETFHSLPADLEEKFMKKFEWPEHFVDTPGGPIAIPYDPQKPARQADLSR